MDKRVKKLAHYVGEDAEALVAAGLDTPRKIKAASDDEIEKIKGIGPAKRKAILERLNEGKKLVKK